MGISKHIILTTFAGLLYGGGYAQTRKIDSLRNLVTITADPALKLSVLLTLCHEKYSLNSDSLYRYAHLAKQVAAGLQDRPGGLLADYYLAYTLLAKTREDSVVKIADAEISTLKYEGETKEVYARYYLLKGSALLRSNKSKASLDVFYAILNEAEKQNDNRTIVEAELGIGNALSTITQYQETLQWNYKAFQLCPLVQAEDYDELYTSALIRQGIAYLHIYEGNPIKAFSDSSIWYATKAMAICKQKEILFSLCQSYILTGYNLSYSQKPKEAEAYLKEGLEVRKKIADPIYVISDMSVLGTFYAKTGQPEKGIAICQEGITIFNQNKLAAQLLLLLNNALAQNYNAAGDYVRYSLTLNQMLGLKDSIYKKNSAEDLTELQAKYDVQKKETTIVKQQLDIANKDIYIISSLGLLAAVLVGGYFFFRYRRKRQAMHMQQLEMAEKQKTIQAVMQAEENERQRIASILHDSVAQKMVVTKLNLEAFEDDLPTLDMAQKKSYENIYSMVDESFTEIRNLSHTMMPKEFYESGLVDALKSFIEKIDQRKMQIQLLSDGDFSKVHTTVGFMIYRIVQECVQNAIKHAKATELAIGLKAENNKLNVSIRDNGVGFDTAQKTGSEGMGISTMQLRVSYLNGEIQVHSKPGNGTAITFQVPLLDNQ